MTMPAASFLTYSWHYVVARLIYDELVRPVTRGVAGSILILVGCVAVVACLLRSRVRRRKR